MNTSAIFETQRSRDHLTKLCHHFGRKVEVDCGPQSGWVQFPFGRCEMKAEAHRLTLRAFAEDPSELEQVVKVMTSHLERFAFRENPSLVWQAPPN